MNPDKNDIHKFLGIKQADSFKFKFVFKRVRDEVTKRVAG